MGGSKGGGNSGEQTALNNMTNLQNQAGGYVNQIAGDANKYSEPLLGGLSNSYAGLDSAVGGNTTGNAAALTGSGGNLKGTTGVDPYSSAANLVSYAGNTGGTNLSGANGGLQGFYGNEMTQGLNPGIATGENAQIQNAATQQLNTARDHAQPGQNMNALTQASQNSTLQAQSGLDTSLAKASQDYMNQGAQGVAGTAQNLDTQNLNMLGTANSAAQGANTSALQDLSGVTTAGTNIIGQSGTFANQGQQNLVQGSNALSGLANSQQALASSMAQEQAQNQANSSGLFGSLVSGAASLFGPHVK